MSHMHDWASKGNTEGLRLHALHLNHLPPNPIGSIPRFLTIPWARVVHVSLHRVSAPPPDAMMQKQVGGLSSCMQGRSISAWGGASHTGLFTFTCGYGVTHWLQPQSAALGFPATPPSLQGEEPFPPPHGSLPHFPAIWSDPRYNTAIKKELCART